MGTSIGSSQLVLIYLWAVYRARRRQPQLLGFPLFLPGSLRQHTVMGLAGSCTPTLAMLRPVCQPGWTLQYMSICSAWHLDPAIQSHPVRLATIVTPHSVPGVVLRAPK